MAFVHQHACGVISSFYGQQQDSTHLCSQQPFYTRRRDVGTCHIRMASSAEGGTPEPGPGESKDPPSGSSITKILEVTFRAVWIKLMTVGVGEDYETALKQFVMGCMAAYKAGYSLMALKLELAANELGKVKVGVDEKGMVQEQGETVKNGGKTIEVDVGLRQQEKDTRMVWIKLVYLTLDRFRYVQESAPVPLETASRGTDDEEMVRGLAALVQSTVDASRRGYTLQTLKMENMMKGQQKELTPAEKSIRSQWMRIVFLTISLIPEQYKRK